MYNNHLTELLEEAEVPMENLCMHRKNMQSP